MCAADHVAHVLLQRPGLHMCAGGYVNSINMSSDTYMKAVVPISALFAYAPGLSPAAQRPACVLTE